MHNIVTNHKYTDGTIDWSQDKMDDDDDAYDRSEDDSGDESSSDDSDTDTDSDQEIPGEIVGQDIPPIANQAGGVANHELPNAPKSPGSLPMVPVASPAHHSTEDPGVALGWANRVSSS